MRLIDADAFCAFLREVSTRQHYETLLTSKDKYPTVADVIEAICCDLDGTSLNGFNNAPTVEEVSVIEFKEPLPMVKAQKIVKALSKRPQGEWIDRMADKGYVECPFCHKQITGGDLNFCVKCGAEMRKG